MSLCKTKTLPPGSCWLCNGSHQSWGHQEYGINLHVMSCYVFFICNKNITSKDEHTNAKIQIWMQLYWQDRRKFCKHQGWHLTNMWPGLQEGSQRKKRCIFAVTLIIGIYVLLLHISLFNFCHANFIWFYDIVMKCCFCLIL